MIAQILLHRELCVTELARGLKGWEEAWDQPQGGTLQLQRMCYLDPVPYQRRQDSRELKPQAKLVFFSLILVPHIYYLLGTWAQTTLTRD